MENILSFYPIKAKDKIIIKHLANAFKDNSRMRVLLGKRGTDFYKNIIYVISYCYFMVKKIGGLFVSKDQNTFLLFYRKSKFYFSLKDCFNYLFLAFNVVGIKRLIKVYLREKKVRSIRQKEIKKRRDSDHLYVWFMAQKKDHNGLKGLIEAKEFIVQRAKALRLPIYMETTELRLKAIYERVGFKFYACMIEEETGLRLWFGRL